jgi:hypothetical protein
LALLPALNLLVQPGRVQAWLHAPIISSLALLPLRPRGVQDTIEFIFSVHSSRAVFSESSGSGKRSSISHEALNAASRLLSSPPTGMSADKWFSGIAPQLSSLLRGEGESEMDKAAAYVIGFGILGRKQYGAPGMYPVNFSVEGTLTCAGMPGWKAFVEPILRCIDPATISNDSQLETSAIIPEDAIVSLGGIKIIASSLEIVQSLQSLSTLVTSHPHPSLTKRILGPIMLPLWSLSRWHERNDHIESCYSNPARVLLKTLLRLSSSSNQSSDKSPLTPTSNKLSIIVQNLTFKGRSEEGKVHWTYARARDGGIQIQGPQSNDAQGSNVLDITGIDGAVDSFIDLINSMPDLDVEISTLFIDMCVKWLSTGNTSTPTSIATRLEPWVEEDSEKRLIEAKVMQRMMTAVPSKLVSDSRQVLTIINEVLYKFNKTNDIGNSNEDTVAVGLSLLNIVLTSPNFRAISDNGPLLEAIQLSLSVISKKSYLDISSTAQNLLLLLRFRNTIDEPDTAPSNPATDQRLEDRKSYNLALSYLTAADSPPPVRAQGLQLLSNLIRANSSILDVPALLVLFSSLLQDNEEYIYLHAIQSFIQLSRRHPRAVMKDLIDRYVDPNEDSDLDQRLRLGEALLQVIQNSSQVFDGEVARSVCEGLLSIAGRRGIRPKTEQEQEKRSKLKQDEDREAEDAWGGPVPQLDEFLETKSSEEIEGNERNDRNQILSQIIAGWESKRGSEDVRIRSSALSILGSAIETNIRGIGSMVISTAVDLSIHTLTLEPELEKGILRRAAILLVMSFVRALDSARADGKKLGFGLAGQSLNDVQRILGYVETTDNDGLVRRHARDVIEGLQSWQINALILPQNVQAEMQELTGLSINPGAGDNPRVNLRPRIEEIE